MALPFTSYVTPFGTIADISLLPFEEFVYVCCAPATPPTSQLHPADVPVVPINTQKIVVV